jgi:hypothetical protein
MARREIIVPICYRDTSMKQSACAATVKLAANERKMIAMRALAGTEPVRTLAVRREPPARLPADAQGQRCAG